MSDYSVSELLEALELSKKRNFIKTLFPDHGPYRRELYKKHMEFFEAGCHFSIRVFMAANQVGKTSSGGLYEVVCHTTGRYPKWWKGVRFEHANNWWVAGETLEDARKVLQERLLGPTGEYGTGLIPWECLDFETMKDVQKDGVLIKSFRVKHISGGFSTISIKSYDQGRKVFQGLPVNVLLDEEPPMDIMVECLARTTTATKENPLQLLMTYTPLKGMSDTIKQLFSGTKITYGDLGNGTYVVNAGVDDVPHITEEAKQKLIANYPAHQRQARMQGVPTITEGAIYGIPEEQFVIAPREIPTFWPRVGGLDVGWNRTAACWLAHDRENGIWHLYREHYAGQMLPSEHAEAIRAKGDWIPLNIDPASRGRSQRDGEQLMQNYKDLGLNLTPANNAVEAGIDQVLTLLAAGRLLVHANCTNFLDEYRRYSRDKDGKVIKKDDHILDALRYAITTHDQKKTGRDIALTHEEWKSRKAPIVIDTPDFESHNDNAWLLS